MARLANGCASINNAHFSTAKKETVKKEIKEQIIKPKKSLDSLIGNIATPQKETHIRDLTLSEDLDINEVAPQENPRELFGSGFTPEEYKILQETYNDYLNNYSLKTTMHRRALIKVCKCTLRYDQAVASNDLDSIKIWDAALSKALKEAKINPEQLSAADLSDGMTSISQLTAAVERAVDIANVLPKYKYTPRDSIDMALYLYSSYVCKIDNKPIPEYKDIYSFMEELFHKNSEKYKDIISDIQSSLKKEDK